jgi:hypothetical protein
MNPSYQASDGPALLDALRLCWKAWVLYVHHPAIGITATILMISFLIVVGLRMVRARRASKRSIEGTDNDS